MAKHRKGKKCASPHRTYTHSQEPSFMGHYYGKHTCDGTESVTHLACSYHDTCRTPTPKTLTTQGTSCYMYGRKGREGEGRGTRGHYVQEWYTLGGILLLISWAMEASSALMSYPTLMWSATKSKQEGGWITDILSRSKAKFKGQAHDRKASELVVHS